VVAAVATASTLEIELWLSVFALVVLQVHCNPHVQLPGLLRITHTHTRDNEATDHACNYSLNATLYL